MTDPKNPDVLYGLDAIASHLGITHNQAKHRVAQKLIPTFKMGRSICALRSKVDAALLKAAGGDELSGA